MTVFAGIMTLDRQELFQEKQLLKAAFEKSCNDIVSFEYADDKNFIVSYDVGAFKERTIVEDEAALCVIAGDPLIRVVNNTIFSDIKLIHQHVGDNIVDILSQAKGVFSGVAISKTDNSSTIFTDKSGIRPVYYYLINNIIVYSSQLSVLESFVFIDLTNDFTGICEKLAFGYCLSNRTIYQKIKRLNVGEYISVKDRGFSIKRYWHWDDIKVNHEVNVSEIYQCFAQGVKLRQGCNKNSIAFLSGGLDSRVIAAQVKENTNELKTFNFSTKRSQDSECARIFAEKAGLQHHEKLFSNLEYPNWAQLMADTLLEHDFENKPYNQRLVWSGDGGSVGVGYVYIDKVILKLLDHGHVDKAISYFLSNNKHTLPINFLNTSCKVDSLNLLAHSVKNELVGSASTPVKAMYAFLMNNDQKRHLDAHFETICQHKTEFLLPFFDSDFLEKIYAVPCKDLLYHQFYMQWFELFPQSTKEAPWQTYPKHVPCPISVPEGLSYQWKKARKKTIKQRFKEVLYVFSATKQFRVTSYLNKYKIYAALFLHLMGIKDFTYLVKIMRKLLQNKNKMSIR
jgi:hypothetical protein